MAARRWMYVAAMALALCATAATASAQVTTGTISGTVKDPQGGVIPGAAVTLTSDTRGTKLPDVFTNEAGEFTFINVPPDTYTVQVSMTGFKPRKQSGIAVSPGDRQSLGVFTVEVGGLTDEVTVQAETPMLQARSGERSFTIPTSAVENLPIANRSFTAIASLAPGVTTTNGLPTGDPVRIGGGGDTNIMMDGVGVMDTGSNRPLLQMNVESIAEVKVLTSGYQAEYGRSSGLQITAVTKSGTNRFRGSVYDVERNSEWYSNTKANKLNGNPKTMSEGEGLGVLDRRPHRQAGRRQQAVLLLQPGILAAHGVGNDRAALPLPDRARARRRLLADDGSERRALQPDQEPVLAESPAPRPTPAAATRTAACSAGSRRRRSIRPG